MTITLRTQSATGATTKGSSLTHAELDDNFVDLLGNKIRAIDVKGDTGTQLVGQTLTNEILQVVGGTGISTAVTSDSAGQARIIITASANVTGAASSTDNAITRFDSTTGKIIQNSLVTVADDGAITAPSVGSVIPFYFANQAAFPSAATYHGALAHSHSDGKVYFAHSSSWNALANAADAFVPASPGEIGGTTPADASFLHVNVKSAASTVKELRLHDQDNSNYVGFKSPATVSTNKVYVLPSTDGSATHVLQTDGSGNLSWAAGSSFSAASPGEIGATTPDIGNFTDLKVKSAASTVKELQLYDQDNSNYVGFKSPTTVTTNKIYVLPSTDGSATHVLQTDGSGNLSWVAQSSFAAASPGEIGATTPADASFLTLNVKSASSVVKEFRLHDQDNSNYVGFKAPVTVGTNRVWTLPSADGTNGQVLQTDGTGTFSFATPSVSVSTGVSGLGSGVATFLATPSSSNLISAITDETGTGALVFATSPTLVTPALGTPASGNLSNTTVDGTNPVGFRDLPAVGTKTTSYTLAVGDVGKYVQVGSGGSITIPNSTFAEGDVVVIANNHTAAITVTCTITDAYIGGTNTDKATVSLATRGVCNILFLSGTACIITGNVS